ncbi:acetyl-CoA synthetase-like protein [Aureobasidium sp. EXF-3400]|nr:acetyl-CoA synthetase-like protein [Aureobasidium sp. EXF-12344]KAI4770237.1 acetyl-CoA synthetase-like protein [Aureobasidium sp. EXF-3400]
MGPSPRPISLPLTTQYRTPGGTTCAKTQLALFIEKKFDLAPPGDAIATADLLDDVLIFGNAQPFPGALPFSFKDGKDIADDELVQKVWPAIEELNSESQDHARTPKEMLVAMLVLDQLLEKSSKGTLLRSVVEARFAQNIDKIYTNIGSFNVGDVPDEMVSHVIIEMIESIVPKKAKLDENTDLFSYGVDSIAGIQIRYGIRQLLPQSTKQLPLNVIEDCGTVRRSSEYVVKQRHGEELTDEEDEHKLMLQLVNQCYNFDNRSPSSSTNGRGHSKNDKGDVIVLTGATRALGTHLLNLYRKLDSAKKVYCLVWGAEHHASILCVNKALQQRSLGDLKNGYEKVEVLQASLGDDDLGLSNGVHAGMAQEVSIVMHVAWGVNFPMRLRSFAKGKIASKSSPNPSMHECVICPFRSLHCMPEDLVIDHLLTGVHNVGVTNLINLALRFGRSEPARSAYCSSVASVMACSKGVSISERNIDDLEAASTLEYSRSKWVVEQICSKANERSQSRVAEPYPGSANFQGTLKAESGIPVRKCRRERRWRACPACANRASPTYGAHNVATAQETMKETASITPHLYWKWAYAPEHESGGQDSAPTTLPLDMARSKDAVPC